VNKTKLTKKEPDILIVDSTSTCFIPGMKCICYAATVNRSMNTYVTLFEALKTAAANRGINLSLQCAVKKAWTFLFLLVNK